MEEVVGDVVEVVEEEVVEEEVVVSSEDINIIYQFYSSQ